MMASGPPSKEQLDAWMREAVAAHRRGDGQQAQRRYRQILTAAPGYTPAREMLGVLADQSGHYAQAIALFEQVIAERPDAAIPYARLAASLAQAGRLDEAAVRASEAIRRQPDDVAMRSGLARTLAQAYHAGGRQQAAIEQYRQLLEYQPESAEAHFNLANLLREQRQLTAALAHYQQALAIRPDWLQAHENRLFVMSYFSLASPAEILAAHQAWARALPPPATVYEYPPDDTERPLRIGYLSGSLRRHSANFFFLPAFLAHDREQFEIYCYAEIRAEDAVSALFREHADGWRLTAGQSDQAVAGQIHADGIDILIDLDGHTQGNRLAVFQYRPAPLQLSYLGYCTTTGLSTMDYWLTDQWLTPEDSVEQTTETIWRLPRCWVGYQPPAGAPEVMMRSPEAPLTLGSLNEFNKLNDDVIALWAAIMKALPEARLLLKTARLSDDDARADIEAAFAAHGIPAGRLHLEGKSEVYLPVYHQIDIALDPFPRTGGVTTGDALWMGVPVITLAGRRMIERQGCSLLEAVGLGECIATTPNEYLDKTVALARDSDKRRHWRQGMRERLQRSSLCDGRDMARHLETAYRQMWRHRQQRNDHDE